MEKVITAEQVRIEMVDKIIDAIAGQAHANQRYALATLALDLAKEYDLPRETQERVGDIILLNSYIFGLDGLLRRIYRVASDRMRMRIRERLVRLGWHTWLLKDPFTSPPLSFEELELLVNSLRFGSTDDGGKEIIAYAREHFDEARAAELETTYNKRKQEWNDLP